MHKLSNKRIIGFILLFTVALLLSAYTLNNKYFDAPKVLKLYELPKAITRDAVPVTGKVAGLQPPKLGDHQHPH